MATNYDDQILGARQQAETAKKLREGFSAPQGQMVSGWYVPPAATQQLAELLKVYVGGKNEDAANADVKRLQGEKSAAIDKWFGELPQNRTIAAVPGQVTPTYESSTNQMVANALRGGQEPQMQNANVAQQGQPTLSDLLRGEQPQQMQSVPAPVQNGQTVTPAQPARTEQVTPEQRLQWIMKGSQLDPNAANLGAKYLEMEQARQIAGENAFQNRQDKKDLINATLQAKQDMATQQNQFAAGQNNLNRANTAAIAAIAHGNKPEKLITVMDENGTPFTIPQSQFQAGMTMYTPASAKAVKAQGDATKAKGEMTEMLSGMAEKYQALKEGGGIVSSSNSGLQNLGARISQSGFGSMVGGAVGTKNAENRQEIEMMRPMLMQTMKQVLGMASSSMNSDADVKLAMQMVSDPSKYTFEANIAQLEKLDKKLGLGLGINKMFNLPTQSSSGKINPPKGGVIKYDANGNRVQ